jgi:hypothetical protein
VDGVAAWQHANGAHAVKQVLEAHRAVLLHAVVHAHVLLLQADGVAAVAGAAQRAKGGEGCSQGWGAGAWGAMLCRCIRAPPPSHTATSCLEPGMCRCLCSTPTASQPGMAAASANNSPMTAAGVGRHAGRPGTHLQWKKLAAPPTLQMPQSSQWN